MTPPLRLAQKSCTGAREANEDCVGVATLGSHACVVVGDGVGGHRGGAWASRVAVHRILEGFRHRPPADARDLGELLLDAHDAVCAAQRAQFDGRRPGAMRSTIVVLIVDLERRLARWGHVGDSRLYYVGPRAIECLTRDDSVVQALMEARLVTPELAADHAMRNYLTAALGAEEPIEPHVGERLNTPRDGDAFLLCTDGWWNSIDADDMRRHLAAVASPEAWLDAMASQVAYRGNPRQDNYSAIACWIGDPNDATQEIPVPRAAR